MSRAIGSAADQEAWTSGFSSGCLVGVITAGVATLAGFALGRLFA